MATLFQPNTLLSDPKPLTTMLPLTLSFNQDQTCFSSSTATGFRVFSCNPLRHLFLRIFPSAGFSHLEMLFQSNILALVGNGSHPQFPLNKLILWDDYCGESFGSLSFRTAIRGVRLRRERIVVLEFHIYVYNFKDLKLLHKVETYANPKGLCVVSQLADSMVLACPGLHKGEVRVEHYAKKKINDVMAHHSSLACFVLTFDGKFLATVREFSFGFLIQQMVLYFRSFLESNLKGANAAEIYSLAFSSTAQWLAVSSDKGTVHVFCLKDDISNTEHEKSQSSSNSSVSSITSFSSSPPFIKFKGVLPKYFNSEWSFAQFRLYEHCRYTVAFGDQHSKFLAWMEGNIIEKS